MWRSSAAAIWSHVAAHRRRNGKVGADRPRTQFLALSTGTLAAMAARFAVCVGYASRRIEGSICPAAIVARAVIAVHVPGHERHTEADPTPSAASQTGRQQRHATQGPGTTRVTSRHASPLRREALEIRRESARRVCLPIFGNADCPPLRDCGLRNAQRVGYRLRRATGGCDGAKNVHEQTLSALRCEAQALKRDTRKKTRQGAGPDSEAL